MQRSAVRRTGQGDDVTDEQHPLWRASNTGLMNAELTIYIGVSLVLLGGAGALLVQSVFSFFTHVDDGLVGAATELLSTLLLVFVFVELVGAVRSIIRERRLIAEPFLLVGIIASIKEIVVIAGAETSPEDDFEYFRNAMIEIGVLAGITLLLAIAALLLRRRQREPSEESE
jgi:LPXTG-motif cell wall-anchored protein